MKKKSILIICSNADVIKEKIVPAIMMIANKGYEIDIVTNKEVDIPFITNKYIINEISSDYKDLKKCVINIKEILNTGNYNIVHTFDNYSSYLLSLCRHNSVETDYYIYAEDLKNSWKKLKEGLKVAEKIIVNNEEDYEFALKKKFNQNVNIIYDLAIDFRKYKNIDKKNEIRKKYNLNDNRKYISIVDTIGKEQYILKILSEVASQHNDICFVFSSDNSRLVEMINKANLGENYKVIEDIKWLELLLIADSILLANLYSYDLMTFIYSLMLGIPMIVPRTVVSLKYIDELKNGFFVDNMNVQQTILAIGRSVNIPKVKIEELGEYNYKKISEFSIDKYVYHLAQLYSEVINQPSKDYYLIESLKKTKESERLIEDIKVNGIPTSSSIIVLEDSINDEKLRNLGAEIIKFDLNSFGGNFRLKKYIEKIVSQRTYNSFLVYGKMQKILKKSKINIDNDSMVIEYKKI